MTNPSDRDQSERRDQDTARTRPEGEALGEYAHVDPDTVTEDAIEFFEIGSEPSPILYPDDPPPDREDAMTDPHPEPDSR